MEDYIVRATAANNQIRAFACTTKNLVEYARSVHGTSPVVTAALGRLLTAGAMMGSMMKSENDLLTLKINGDGPIKGILVTADANANVKGYAYQPEVHLPLSNMGKLDVGKSVGKGVLNVIKDMGLKEPYVGQTTLVSGEIAEDITYYYATSEQVPSSVALGVLVNSDKSVKEAGGFIIQLLPFAEEEVITKLEEKISQIKSVTSMLDAAMTPEMILEELLGELGLEIMDKVPTKFYCNCTKDRVEKAIISIGEKDIQEMINDNEPIEVNCHFCNEHYKFSVEDLKKIIVRSKKD